MGVILIFSGAIIRYSDGIWEIGDGQDDFRVQVTTVILRRYPNRLNFTNMHFKIGTREFYNRF